MKLLKKIWNKITDSIVFIFSNLFAVILEVIIVGLTQVIFDYGNMKIYFVCFCLGLLHLKLANLMKKLLTA